MEIGNLPTTTGKRIYVIVPGAGVNSVTEVELQPGFTVQTIKTRLPYLAGFDFFKSHDSLRLREDVDLYEKLLPESRLYVASHQDVGD
jgi:hypothetical protein